ncbi:MAG TPA: MmcQ/YjbR family DNA-binding protein [Byssovorax sp.]|jgi:hypothetical protein
MATWDTVVDLGLALDGVELSTSYGTPALKVKGKLVARLKEDGRAVALRVADLDEKEGLLATEADALFTTPHYDGHAYVLVRLAKIERARLAELLRGAHAMAAPASKAAKKAIQATPKKRARRPG